MISLIVFEGWRYFPFDFLFILARLQAIPKEFYEAIKPYMLELTYEDFKTSLSDIVWIHKEISPELKKRMQEGSFPTRDLI